MSEETQDLQPGQVAQPVEAPAQSAVVESQTSGKEEVAVDKNETEFSHGDSLLSQASDNLASEPSEKKVEAPTEKAIDEDKKDDENKTIEEAPKEELPPVAYEDFKLPEGVNIPKEQLGQFTDVIGQYGVPQEAAQKLMDMHFEAFKSMAEKSVSDQWQVFHDQQKQWKDEVMADPILGGNGHQTAMSIVAKGRDALIKPSEMEEFNHYMSVTGAGNVRLLNLAFHRAGMLFGEGSMRTSSIKPPPDIGVKPTAGKTELFYDHPSSFKK